MLQLSDYLKNKVQKYKTWYSKKIPKYYQKLKSYEISEIAKLKDLKESNPPTLFPTRLHKLPSTSAKTSKFRKPRPSWTIAKPGVVPKDYPLAEPFPGLIPFTPPPIIFPRKVIKLPELEKTNEMVLNKENMSAISPFSLTTNKPPALEPFYIHEAMQMVNNVSHTTEGRYRINPVYYAEKENSNRNSSDDTHVASNHKPYFDENLREGIEKSRTQSSDKLDYLLQPRKLKKLHTLRTTKQPTGHFITQQPESEIYSTHMLLKSNQVSLRVFSVNIVH